MVPYLLVYYVTSIQFCTSGLSLLTMPVAQGTRSIRIYKWCYQVKQS